MSMNDDDNGDDPKKVASHTLRLLQEIRGGVAAVKEDVASLREDMASRFSGVLSRFEQVDQRFDAVDQRFDKLELEVAAMRTDQGRMAVALEEIREDQHIHGDRLATIETRLGVIDKRLRPVKA